MAKRIFLIMLVSVFCLSHLQPANAQQRDAESMGSRRLKQLIRSGQLTEPEIRESLEAAQENRLGTEMIREYREKADLGTLTPEEIESGRELFQKQRKAFLQEQEDRIYLYGNVQQPGEYEYVSGMRVLDILPDLESFKEDTFFDYALIKRYRFLKTGEMEAEGNEKASESDREGKDRVFYAPSRTRKRESMFTGAEGDRRAELITFDLGRLYFSDDETQNLLLMPQDEIYIFSREMMEEDEEAEPPEEKEEEAPLEDPFFKREELPEPPELEIFGHNLFQEPPSTFAPIDSVPVSTDYIIGPGDEITVLMWGRMDEQYALTVDNEGVIQFPKIGPLTVAGLTFGELKDLIHRRAEAITGVNVSVSMGKLKTIQVFILGEAISPGIYTVSALATVTNALISAGGPTELGSLRNIQLKRNGRVIQTIDLYEFLLEGDTTGDINLISGDVIFIPQAGPMVSVAGNVKREAIYELKDDRSLDRVLELAGGLAPGALNQRIQIERSARNQDQVVLDITENRLKSRQGRIRLQDGDLVRVFSIAPEAVNAVYLYGNVRRTGQYAYEEGLRIKDVIPDLEMLKQDTHLDYALIKRYRRTDAEAELIPFDLGKLLVSGDPSQNLPLRPRDEIYIFNRDRFEDRPSATVEGEVRKPGSYTIYDMTIRDLILKAGDLTTDAYLQKGELVRMDEQRNRHTIYFDVAAAMANDPAENLKVQNEDLLIIHSVSDDQWEPYVVINGEVNRPGRYLLSQGMRLKDLFFKAGNFTRDAYLNLGHLRRTAPHTREMTIHTFDVEKAAAGAPRHNLTLTDMDEVIIHSIWEYREQYTVAIKGLVRNPGDYPYASNMTINDLILLAGNVRDAAYMEEAELARFSIVEGREVRTRIIQFNIRLAKENHPQHNLDLQPLDVVTIKEIPNWWDKKQSVKITGEVFFPGTYQIRKEERLSDVIARAGGFTEHAYLRGAVFTRESVRKIQQSRINDMLEKLELEVARLSSQEVQASLSQEDLAAQRQFVESQRALLEKLRDTRATGRVVIALASLPEFAGESTDMVVEGGDTLHIPKRPHTVNVIGAVHNPTALIHDEANPDLRYYLNLTGGPTENADEDLMYVIRTDGTVVSKMTEDSWWKKFENTELHPGDTVLVPEKVTRTSFMRDAKDITEILYQIAVTAGITVTQIF